MLGQWKQDGGKIPRNWLNKQIASGKNIQVKTIYISHHYYKILVGGNSVNTTLEKIACPCTWREGQRSSYLY